MTAPISDTMIDAIEMPWLMVATPTNGEINQPASGAPDADDDVEENALLGIGTHDQAASHPTMPPTISQITMLMVLSCTGEGLRLWPRLGRGQWLCPR
jgi:hypothetical protein